MARASEEQQLAWKETILRQKESGLSIKTWCRQNQIRFSAFYYWKDKLFSKSLDRANFTEFGIKKDCALTLECPGVRISLESNCDPVFKKQLLSSFLEIVC